MQTSDTNPFSRNSGLFPKSVKDLRYRTAQTIRAAWYSGQFGLLARRAGGFQRPGEPAFEPKNPPGDPKEIRKSLKAAFDEDLANVKEGLYPQPEDVRPRDFVRALQSAVMLQRDAVQVNRRRMDRNGQDIQEDAPSKSYPNYYKQNFHYQSGGWFTEESARIYDTQVEALFAGAADVMRRSALAEVAREIRTSDRRDQSFLDVASGTGRFLAQVMAAYPRLNAKGLDLSPAYCAHARQTLKRWPKVDVIESSAEAMPIEDNSADLVTCIYLFHELPPRYRNDVAKEIFRVTRPGGFFVFADSIQPGDNPPFDRRTEIFPEAFHEPYYKSYSQTDLSALFSEAGFVQEGSKVSFVTKVMWFRKPV